MVDVMPDVKWTSENGYKNLKIVVELDQEISAEIACEQELRRRHKALGILRIVADRGLEVNAERFLNISQVVSNKMQQERSFI